MAAKSRGPAADDRIAAGDVIESVDDRPVETAVARVPRWATAGYAERTRRHDAHRWLLLGRGVVPHEAVPTDLVHVRAGSDPALDAAVA